MLTDEAINTAVGCSLSEEQLSVCKEIVSSKQNLLIEAVAGSGKTYTLKAIIRLIKFIEPNAKVLYLVFGKKNQLEAQEKIPESLATVKTFHSLGFAGIRQALKGKINIDNNKIRDLVLTSDVPDYLYSIVKKLVELAKCRGLGCINEPSIDDTAAYEELIDHHGLDLELLEAETEMTLDNLIDEAIFFTKKVLKISTTEAYTGWIDFADQLYIAALDHNAFAKDYQKYDYVLIDEGQDTNRVRMILADKICKSNGRIIIVGDRKIKTVISHFLYGCRTPGKHIQGFLIARSTKEILLNHFEAKSNQREKTHCRNQISFLLCPLNQKRSNLQSRINN